MTAGDRAGGTYWDGVWRNAEIIAPADPGITGRNNYVERRFAEFFRHALGDGKGKKLLEVGAANSAWLPYFAIHQGFNVAGLDYSDGGCAQARAVLQRAGVAGTITCADMFDPPEALVGAFDSVVSFGVVEHFERVEDAVRAVATFCSPGGIVATVVPNMTGLIGALQRRL